MKLHDSDIIKITDDAKDDDYIHDVIVDMASLYADENYPKHDKEEVVDVWLKGLISAY